MMKDLKELFTPVVDRIKNPFFGSVAVSWLIVNWRVIIALVGYTLKDLEKEGASTYIGFVILQGEWRLIYLPLILGILYILINPFINMGNSALHEFVRRRSSRVNRSIAGGGYVPIEKYLSHKKKYDDLSKEFVDLIDQESELQNKLSENTNEIAKLKVEIKEFITEEEKLKERATKMVPSGDWTMTLKDSYSQIINTVIRFDTGMSSISLLIDNNRHVIFRIDEVVKVTSNTSLILRISKSSHLAGDIFPTQHIQYLEFKDNYLSLEGTINNSIPILYSKKTN